MSFLKIHHLSLEYPLMKKKKRWPRLWCHRSTDPQPTSKVALKNVSLEIPSGELACLLGPNGGGKTSLLRSIAGFERPTQGSITLQGEVIFRSASPAIFQPSEHRRVGMVFQNLALFPHLKVRDNITFGISKLPTAEKTKRLHELLELFEIKDVQHCYGFELSGGLRQRVALARALAPQPRLLLLDEPFSNLDLEISLALSRKLRTILADRGITALMVSHNRSQAFELAHSVAIMVQGEILQHSTPADIYAHPHDYRVAAFLGESSFVKCTAVDDGFITPFGRISQEHVYDLRRNPIKSQARMGLRSESLQLVKPSGSYGKNSRHNNTEQSTAGESFAHQHQGLDFKILKETFQGYYKIIRAQIPTGEIVELRLPSDTHHDLSQYRICLKNTKVCIYE